MTASKDVTIIVNRKFIDKRTKATHNVGDIVKVTRSRFNEIRKADSTLVQLFDGDATSGDGPAPDPDGEGEG